MKSPAPKRAVIRSNKIEEAEDSDVDFELGSPSKFFGSHVNLIPLQSAVAGPRLFYGARFLSQAMPIVNREAPLVQTAIDEDPEGRSFDDYYGQHMGAARADQDAKVHRVTKDHVELEYQDGSRSKIGIYNNFPMNRKTGLTSRAIVKAGDQVKKDSPLTVSNFTDDNGTLAMGANARVGLVPYKGYSMDDSVVISEAFARRLSQEAMYGFDAEYRRGVKGGKSHHIGLFPNKFTKSQLDILDDDGVIQVGQKVGPGDPLILASRPKVISSQQAQLGKLSSHMKNARADASTVWGEDEPGVVTDVKKLPRGVRVNVQVHQPTKVGDKMVFRSGQKSYHPDTEVLTERGWCKIPDLLGSDKVAALFEGNVGRFVKPLHANSYVYDGELCMLDAKYAAYAVTPNHRIWRKGHTKGCSDWYCLDAQKVHGTCQSFMIAAPFDLSDRIDPVEFIIAEAHHGITGDTMDCVCRFPFKVWVEFMALYLAEGNVKHADSACHDIVITQKEKPFCRTIERVLNEMGMKWKKVNNQFIAGPNKALRLYLDQFGKAHDKFVPQEIKDATPDMIRLFLDTIWMCDGDKTKGRQYYTCSPGLRDDVQMLLALLGQGTTWQTRSPRSHQNFEQYTLNKLDQSTTGTRKNYEHAYGKLRYRGPVFCLQVSGLGVIMIRFRGRVMWNGNSVVSLIVPDHHMPRTMDGNPLEVLLNPLGIPSRVNNSLIYELLLGKAAAKHGKPYRLNGFNRPGEKWYDFVKGELDKHGLAETDEVFDPQENRKLENPITTGVGHVLKLHHTSGSKISTRGQGSYDVNEQPSKGGGDLAQAKRLSGLETHALLSAGAYGVLRDMSTLRGQRNDEYWRSLRSGHEPRTPGIPFAFNKFHALLNGAGFHARKLPDGVERLSFWTDKDLAKVGSKEVKSGELVDPDTLEATPGGLFDDALTGNNSWGHISLPFKVPNPAAEKAIRKMLSLTEKQFRAILAGEEEMSPHLLTPRKHEKTG